MNKSQFERGDWVTVNTGSLKGAQGKIKRVDQKKGTVCVEFDQGFVLNTYKTHTMSWNNVTVTDLSDGYYQSPAMIRLLNSKKGKNMDLISLEQIAAQCKLCSLHMGQIRPVFARGWPEADILICGMCPGPDENNIGVPFVGLAGKILDEILDRAFSLKYKVYITNLVKCFVPPGKNLEEAWMNTCFPYFIVQLQLIKPKVIIALGKDVCNFLLNNNDPIGAMRGNVYDYMNTKLICTYHPAFLARGNFGKFSKIVIKDFKKALNFV